MHRKTPLSHLLYTHLYPSPTPSDPQSFSSHLSKNLVSEVRIETATFYGSLDTTEARYPGLNYTSAPHRKRLGRFPHHAKLFEAFDKLGLTDSEILGFCRWEGTLWARERFERDEGVKVRDTTGEGIGEWVDRRGERRDGGGGRRENSGRGISVKTDIEVEIEEVSEPDTVTAPPPHTTAAHPDAEMTNPDPDPHSSSSSSSSSEDSDSDPEPESVGVDLNQRLIQAAVLRAQGVSAPMDADWEQFFKDAQERGLNSVTALEMLRSLGQSVWGEVATARAARGAGAA